MRGCIRLERGKGVGSSSGSEHKGVVTRVGVEVRMRIAALLEKRPTGPGLGERLMKHSTRCRDSETGDVHCYIEEYDEEPRTAEKSKVVDLNDFHFSPSSDAKPRRKSQKGTRS